VLWSLSNSDSCDTVTDQHRDGAKFQIKRFEIAASTASRYAQAGTAREHQERIKKLF
jgi:hypothetical protein